MSAGGEASSQPKAFPLRMAWALSRFLLRTGRSRLKMVSWSLSSSDSDIIRLELCSVLRCLIPAERKGVWVWASFKPAAISYTHCLVSWILLMWNSGDFVLTVSSRRPDQRCSLLGLFFIIQLCVKLSFCRTNNMFRCESKCFYMMRAWKLFLFFSFLLCRRWRVVVSFLYICHNSDFILKIQIIFLGGRRKFQIFYFIDLLSFVKLVKHLIRGETSRRKIIDFHFSCFPRWKNKEFKFILAKMYGTKTL